MLRETLTVFDFGFIFKFKIINFIYLNFSLFSEALINSDTMSYFIILVI